MPHIADGPERWVSALGVYKPVHPRWFLLLKYTVREAGTVARPTQLDAGWGAYHFPSPPRAPLPLGGHPMDLRLSPPATSVLPEFVHKQIRHTLRHWSDGGRHIGRTSAPSGGTLVAVRLTHHELLTRVYGPSVVVGMPTCI